jgi:hypothetical protein
MGHEDRERKFEQALAQHLRADAAGARNEADARADVRDETVGTDTCPDAGKFAAFHEGMLLSEEMNATQEHIAGCSRCQQILLQLEATDEVPLQVEAGNDLKMREPIPSSGARYEAIQTPSLAIAGQAKKPALKAPQDISRGRGFRALRWAAPAGAIAAGLLIWIVVRNGKVQTARHFDDVQVAQEQLKDERLAAPRPIPTGPAAESVTKSKQLNERRKDDSRIKQPAEESGALRAPGRYSPNVKAKSANRGVASLNSLTAAPTPDSRTNAPIGARQYSNLIALAPSPAKPESPSPNQSTSAVSASAAPIVTSSADVGAQSAAPMPTPPPTHPRASSGAPANAADAKAEATQTYTTQTIIDEAPALETERVPSPGKLHEPSFETKGKSAVGKKVLAPGGKVLWRIRPKGQIERSSNGGVSWLPQNSGVNVELTAGSAPSNSVCWIIGRGGTILKTTDGGAHWSKVAWPNAGEISGIQATDAMHAVVYDVTAVIPARLATNDGGVTWFRTNK